jgi:hypothetical protein
VSLFAALLRERVKSGPEQVHSRLPPSPHTVVRKKNPPWGLGKTASGGAFSTLSLDSTFLPLPPPT